jgi:hypothetical protein
MARLLESSSSSDLPSSAGVGRHGVIQVGDVGLVVAGAMDIHRHGVNVGLEGVVRVSQLRAEQKASGYLSKSGG